MQNIKPLLGVITVLLTFIGYAPYIRDTLQEKTKPHVYTWFIWGIVTMIAYGLQVSGGAGVGSWVTLAVALFTFLIFVLGIKMGGRKDITKSDTLFFLLSFVALFLWLIAKQPVLSVVLVSTIDLLGFVPTIRKSWNKPYSETLFTYELNILRHGLSLLTLQHYSIVTWLYPGSWVLANLFFSIMLIIKRGEINR